ncbi:MAG: hypothetical protein KME67_15435 [Candidatus Thiodiazotropha sp. (ex Codakia orbicularis)]|nr:hypothetical protein [Candidatus Thiodiazotropha sp. (ex Codakia orbicularis)]
MGHFIFTILRIVGIIFLVETQSIVLADWTVTKRVDAMTDEVRKSAIIKNKLGHTFSIYRISPDGEVWGNFALAEGTFDQVDWKKPPIYRIDKHKPNDLESKKRLQEMGLGIHAYEWEPKWVNFLMWHGKEDEGLSDSLVQLMEGKRVVFRYYLGTGGFKDTSFPLKGSSSAIAEAIGISAKVDHSIIQKRKNFNHTYTAEYNQCKNNMSTFRECVLKISNCRKKSQQDIEKFKSCI